MKAKDSGIYYIKSKHNNKIYVGQSIDIQARWRKHTTKLKDNKHHSIHLQNHFNKYGIADLEFCILEIINQNDLCLQDYKNLLNSREQFYMDNLGNDFNCQPVAGSSLGYKHTQETKLKLRLAIVGTHTKDLKGYIYEKGRWRVIIRINETRVRFGSYKTEQEAIDKVNLVLSKTQNNPNITKELLDSLKQVKPKAKNCYFSTNKNKWEVIIRVNSKSTYFGCYDSEEEAQLKVEYIETLSDIELTSLIKQNKKSSKGYFFDKTTNKWRVQLNINGKYKSFGYYNLEEEAQLKVKELLKNIQPLCSESD